MHPIHRGYGPWTMGTKKTVPGHMESTFTFLDVFKGTIES